MKHGTERSAAHGSFSIPSLDGLRAVSFLIVFFGHATAGVIPAGFGVTVFFFLSGYLITTLLRLEAQKSGTVSLKLFYLRRALRIWPPFYIVLFSASALTAAGVLQGKIQSEDLLAQCFHYANYSLLYRGADGIAHGTAVYWSLAVEEHFYLFFPALYLLLKRQGASPRAQSTVFLGICAATLLWRCALVLWLHAVPERTYLGTDTRIDSMLFGCWLAVAGNPMLDLPKKERPGISDLAFLGAGIAGLLVSFLFRSPVFRETWRYTLQGLALYPIFVTAIRFPDFPLFRPLNLRPVQYLGTISFSLYLVHHAILGTLEDHGLKATWWIFLPLGLGLSVAVASAMWFLVEKPCADVRRRLSSGSGAKAARPAIEAAIGVTPEPP